MRFRDRGEAGEMLAERLVELGVEADVVLAVPRGGLPLGRAVADALDAPLDVVVAKKIGAPGNPELAVGAATSDGSVWLNEALLGEMGLGEAYLDDERRRVARLAAEKEEKYGADGTVRRLEGRRVVVVDDGVATGATAVACLRSLAAAGASRVVLAVPVGPPDTLRRLEAEADEVVCIHESSSFQAVGQFYDSFDQVSDEEAIGYLRGSRGG